MKKTVKFFGFVLLVTMLFSLMASSASAIVSDDTAGVNGGGIVIGGGGNVSVNSGGSLIIGGDERPVDDSPFTGIRVDDVNGNNTNGSSSKKTYSERLEAARAANGTASAEFYAQEAAAKYMKKSDGDYSGIVDSEYTLVQENEDFLMYVRDNLDSIDEATLQTALDLFGDVAVYGTGESEVDEEAIEDRRDEISARLDEIAPRLDELEAAMNAIAAEYVTVPEEAEEGEEVAEGESVVSDYTQNPDYQALLAEFNTLFAEFTELNAEDEGLNQFMSEKETLMAGPDTNPVLPVEMKSRFSEVCPGYSSLAEAVSGSNYYNVLRFNGNSFDICNSTDYRITVDLHAATIDARACEAAFTIRAGRYGGTVTFTNGTIVGDGFYVFNGGVLNLGGLVNGNYVDITVYAAENAVYVDAGGTAVIGQGTTLIGGIPGQEPTAGTAYKPDATRYTQCSIEPVVYITNGGIVKTTGGTIRAVSVDGTGNPAAMVNNHAIEVNNGNLEVSSSVAEITSNNPYAPAIFAHNGSDVKIHAGFVYGPTGIAVRDIDTRLNVNGGAITGYGSPNKNFTTTNGNTGAAIAVYGDPTVTGNSPFVFVNGGTLRSERTAGITSIPIDGSRYLDWDPTDTSKTNIKRITVDDVNVTIQQVNGENSDYAHSLYLVTGTDPAINQTLTSGYSSLDEAITAANGLTGNVTIELIYEKGDIVPDGGSVTPIMPDIDATSYTFDGNGYQIKTPSTIGSSALTIDANASGYNGPVTIKNVTFNGAHTIDGIEVWSGNEVIIGPNVTVEHYRHGLDVDGGIVKVNGLNIEAHNEVGIYCTSGKTTIVFCKNDSSIPVMGLMATPALGSVDPEDYLLINGGWFAYKEADTDGDGVADEKVAFYVDPDTSFVKFVEKDNYYEVLYNDTPNVEIDTTITKRYGNEKQPDGTNIPYIVYDKSNPDPLVFKEVMPSLIQIDAVPIMTQDNKVIQVPNKTVYPIFTAEAGKTGTIRIPDRAVLEDLPSGRYDLRFTFKNGYIMENKLRLYVFPKYAGLFAVPNTKEISPSQGTEGIIPAVDEFFNGNIVEYLNDNFDLIKTKTAYPIGAIGWNVAVVTSELPDKVTIGNAADNTNSILLENYIYNGLSGNAADDRTTWGVVPTGPYAGYYFYIISYADLNNLSAGQNWVFLNWNGFDGALKNLPLTIKNDYVTISPTKVDWSKIDNYVNFTVNPAPQTVYVDGELVPSGYWTYDASTKTLSIKGTYFAPLESKDHTLEVVTGLGKASATVKTGMGLKANGIDYHVYGGNRVVNFQASDRINQDAGIWIGSSNPTKLDPSAYTWNGTNGFTLNPAFLNRLALGTYYISAYVYNGNNGYNYTTTTFRVISATQASNNPATGDNSNITLWLVILALSATALVVIIVPQFKKSKSMH